MKMKLLLFMLLSLLAFQGWATPVDSLDTQSFRNSLTKWNSVVLSNHLALKNGFEPFNIDFCSRNSGGYESKAPSLRSFLDKIYFVYGLLQDAYDIYTYFDNQTEWVRVASPKRSEVIVGKYYELYVTIYAKTDFPIEPHYFSYTEAFDFSSCPEVIYVEELESNDCYRV